MPPQRHRRATPVFRPPPGYERPIFRVPPGYESPGDAQGRDKTGSPILLDNLNDDREKGDDQSTTSTQKPDILDDPFAWLANVCGYSVSQDSATLSKLDQGLMRMISSRDELLQGLWQSVYFHRQEASQARESLSVESKRLDNATNLVRSRVRHQVDERARRDFSQRLDPRLTCPICWENDIDTMTNCGQNKSNLATNQVEDRLATFVADPVNDVGAAVDFKNPDDTLDVVEYVVSELAEICSFDTIRVGCSCVEVIPVPPETVLVRDEISISIRVETSLRTWEPGRVGARGIPLFEKVHDPLEIDPEVGANLETPLAPPIALPVG
ncbi:hypothetical protein OEA41_010763 [Lepraria neglecta]|uniref:Uncharacterized protein n=1 Tax=Lepraria neglecta TaxID=209136 RepID=A0AAE0DFF4_9LECA|nr:hypothetical protein OEA41_010763 [Lepraria neglecta]